jgi:hypothetical protein
MKTQKMKKNERRTRLLDSAEFHLFFDGGAVREAF